MKKISFRNTDINCGFWKVKQDMVKDVTVRAVYDRFKETHRFDALKCKWREGDPHMPHIFWDSDIAKWIEGVAYLLEKEDLPDLRAIVEEAIDDIIANADAHGYFNSHFLVTEQDKRFTKRDCHELYCAGHLIEAAVAYYKATGEKRFLDAMCRYADYIERVFKIEKSAAYTTPGHPELELALIKLWEATGEKRYLSLAEFFINEHGTNAHGDEGTFDWFPNSVYNQDDVPLKDRTTIDGHSVRSLYLYSGAADIARLCDKPELAAACELIFENAVNKRMYVTGGVGSTHCGEAFTADYDLPNRTAYTETCAAIALVYFASRMQLLAAPDSKYADCIERVLYNGFLSGVSLDGKAFFYENPLEIVPRLNSVHSVFNGSRFPITQRKEVFNCSCCPPNIVRFIPSVADYAYTYDDGTLYIHQYIGAKTVCDGMEIEQNTDYPASGSIRIKCASGGRRIALRIPEWCKSFSIDHEYTLEGGYAILSADVSEIRLELDMPVTAVRANRKVYDGAGRIALMRGPVVYCAEGIDNGDCLKSVKIDPKGEFTVNPSDFLLPTLHTTAYTLKESDKLYSVAGDDWKELPLTLIPYYAFANRGTTEMQVWLLEKS